MHHLSQEHSKSSHWIATWTASTQPLWGEELPFPNNMAALSGQQTVALRLRVSLGGKRLRLLFSNEYGTQPLILGPVSVALGSNTQKHQTLLFSAQPQAVIAAGKTLLSDPLELDIPDLASLFVRFYLPQRCPVSSFHWDTRRTVTLLPGNQTLVEHVDSCTGTEITALPVLSAAWVETSTNRSVVAVIGDSLVDGNGVSIDSDQRWTDHLAKHLVPHGVAVVNAGQSGSRLRQNGIGISAKIRFERDVLNVPGIRLGILQVGLNDLGWPGTSLEPDTAPPSAAVLITAYQDLIAQAHAKHIPLVGLTLTPFKGAFGGSPFDAFFTPEKEAIRQALNTWMRSSQEFDALIDLDTLLRDPQDPQRLRAALDVGDHLHPHNHGNQLIAESISIKTLLSLLQRSEITA
ncbi:SGNH/GDSL hydrolase family protein [Alcaligenes aquatilis]|uniref:SGNH/GDSL hydrolase family protein n=1 Tax=Alcaligenes aquatilis TaxID=323284 RepID=A0A3G2HV69_9BURK|nr:SGNH/GDSL hydrolase family protein [Alcaligenes aquatilis]AYN21040.1 SGNH/GDSL hydrolase family protein [Alcaligenes aquatilis]